MIGFNELLNRNKPKKKIEWTEVNPYTKHFFDNVLNYKYITKNEFNFLEAIKYIIDNNKLSTFYIPEFYFTIFDESSIKLSFYLNNFQEINDNLLPQKHNNSYLSFSKNCLKHMKKSWNIKSLKIGNPFQYYLFLVALINRFVDNGYHIARAIDKVILNRSENYYVSCSFLCKGLSINKKYCLCGKFNIKYPHYINYKPLADLEFYKHNGRFSGNVFLFITALI